MRYAHNIARTAFAALNALNRRHLNVDDLSDYMRRDLGLIDGRSVVCEGFAANDGRSRRLDLMTLTPYAS
jgi:phosphatidylserine/phosphatidylglycerophosphate/cardiolipin synthase-like enzyme